MRTTPTERYRLTPHRGTPFIVEMATPPDGVSAQSILGLEYAAYAGFDLIFILGVTVWTAVDHGA